MGINLGITMMAGGLVTIAVLVSVLLCLMRRRGRKTITHAMILASITGFLFVAWTLFVFGITKKIGLIEEYKYIRLAGIIIAIVLGIIASSSAISEEKSQIQQRIQEN